MRESRREKRQKTKRVIDETRQDEMKRQETTLPAHKHTHTHTHTHTFSQSRHRSGSGRGEGKKREEEVGREQD